LKLRTIYSMSQGSHVERRECRKRGCTLVELLDLNEGRSSKNHFKLSSKHFIRRKHLLLFSLLWFLFTGSSNLVSFSIITIDFADDTNAFTLL
jgi:hypothetical protein